MVAVTILAIVLVLSIQPLMAALDHLGASQELSAAEKLAQSEIEAILALNYDDVGLPGLTPSGVLQPTHTVVVAGQSYTVETQVRYAGSLTGLNVVPQGGDGVQGTWDPGVNYKVVTVSVTAADGEAEPVVMDAIVAPSRVGALDGVASVRVTIAAYEPFAVSGVQLPSLKLQSSSLADVRSGTHDATQVFPGVPVATWTAQTDDAAGWAILPADILAGRNVVVARIGAIGDAAFRVYRPATLQVTVLNATTGQPVPNFTLSLLHVPSGTRTNYPAGQGTVGSLVPDAYQVTVAASGYQTFTSANMNIPAGYPNPAHLLTVQLTPNAPPATSTTMPAPYQVTFTVYDNTGRMVNGATVAVLLPSGSTVGGTTDANGRVVLAMAAGNCTATASTTWGHGPASTIFDPKNRNQIQLWLTRPSGMGTGVLSSGARADFVYRARRSDPWTVLPANALGEASFVGLPANYLVAKRCQSDGSIQGERTLPLRADRDRFTSVNGSCR